MKDDERLFSDPAMGVVGNLRFLVRHLHVYTFPVIFCAIFLFWWMLNSGLVMKVHASLPEHAFVTGTIKN
jgi:hypothetical protein